MMNIDKFVEFIFSKNDSEIQEIICIEELAELQKELTKHLRGKENWDHIVEEIADVQLMIYQMQHYFQIDPEEIERRIANKIDRTLNKITG